jgi:predicted secreted protein
MSQKSGILLNEHFVNILMVNKDLVWAILDSNASTGYTWSYVPDNSGLTELEEELTLHPSAKATGVAGKKAWIFKAARKGVGTLRFDHHAPGKKEPETSIIYKIEVQ